MNGLVIAVFFIALPFIIYGIVVAFLSIRSLSSLRMALSRKVWVRWWVRLLAVFAVLTLLAGGYLIGGFLSDGGPNQGLGKHLIESPHNRYQQLQIGMIVLLAGSCMAYFVHGVIKGFSRTKLSIIFAASFVIVSVFIANYYTHDKQSTQQYAAYTQQQSASFAKLPPVYMPSFYADNVPAEGSRSVLIPVDDDKSGYTVSYYGRLGGPFFGIVGHFPENVKSYFDPANNVCDIQGLQFGRPVGAATCVTSESVAGGTLYTSNQTPTSNRPQTAWVKDGYVYFVTTGSTLDDVKASLTSMRLIPKDQIEKYLIY